MFDKKVLQDLDNYEGELVREWEKLEMERDRGTLKQDEQADFLADLREAYQRRHLTPLRRRATQTGLATLGLGGVARFLPVLVPGLPAALPLVAGFLALLLAGHTTWSLVRLRQQRQQASSLLAPLEAQLRQTGRLL